MLPSLHAVGDHERSRERQVVAGVHGHRVVVERAGQDPACLLDVKRELVAAVALSRLSAVECCRSKPNGVQRAAAARRVVGSSPSAIRSLRSVGSLRTSSEIELLSRSLAIDTDHDVRCDRAVRQRRLRAGDERAVGGRERVPVLRLAAEREVRGEEVRLVEVEPHAPIERRPPRVHARCARAAEEVEVVVLGVDARLFLGAVPHAEIHALMLALGDRDARRDLSGCCSGFSGSMFTNWNSSMP